MNVIAIYTWCAVASVCAASGGHVVVYKHFTMSPADFTSQKEGLQICECMKQCFVLAECRGVTFEVKDSATTCHFSTNVGVQGRLQETGTSNTQGGLSLLLSSVLGTPSASAYVTIVKKGCSPGFDKVGEFCYFFSEDVASFNDALNGCPEGSSLAFPSTAARQKALSDFAYAEKDGADWYLDLSLQNGKWYWSDGVEVVADNLGTSASEPCARLIVTKNELFDTPCGALFHYVCQYGALD